MTAQDKATGAPAILPLVARIDAILPQTQCTKCGFEGCKPYATAIAEGRARINQCPPGGAAGIEALARLLGREPLPLDPAHGVEKPREVAVIDENVCIGCTLCIQACPVDAIAGAAKQMHTIIESWCTGCELCVAPCPVDCISMQALPAHKLPADGAAKQAFADLSRDRFEFRKARLAREAEEKAARLAARLPQKLADKGVALPAQADGALDGDAKKALIAAALARARAQTAQRDDENGQR